MPPGGRIWRRCLSTWSCERRTCISTGRPKSRAMRSCSRKKWSCLSRMAGSHSIGMKKSRPISPIATKRGSSIAGSTAARSGGQVVVGRIRHAHGMDAERIAGVRRRAPAARRRRNCRVRPPGSRSSTRPACAGRSAPPPATRRRIRARRDGSGCRSTWRARSGCRPFSVMRSTRSQRRASSMSWVTMTKAVPSVCDSSSIRSKIDWRGGVVEVAGRLVGQHAGRLGDQRARQRHALAFAAGQLARHVRHALAQARPAPGSPAPAIAPRRAARAGSSAASPRCRAPRTPAAGGGTGRRSRAPRCAGRRGAVSDSVAKSSPSSVTMPVVGVSSPPSRCSSVDLPEPDAPTMATRSPRCDAEVDWPAPRPSSRPG